MTKDFNFNDLLKIAEQMKPVHCVIYVVDGYWPHDQLHVRQDQGEAILFNGSSFKLFELQTVRDLPPPRPTDITAAHNDNFCHGIPIKRISAAQAAEIVVKAIKTHEQTSTE